MGVLTDLVIARRDEAESVAAEASPAGRWPGLDVKGHNSVTLGTLLGIVCGDEEADFDNELVASGGDEGPWVTAVPAPFVDALAGVPDDRLAALAATWAATEEFAGLCTPDEARATIVALRELCRRAKAGGGSMLMWMSL